MNKKYALMICLVSNLAWMANGQQRVGVNTTTPVRALDIYGNGIEYLRIHSTTALGSQVGLEMLRGDQNSAARDWRMGNESGTFKIKTGTDDFSTPGDEVLRITEDGHVGIGTTVPLTPLHIDGGEDASNTSNGYLMIGNTAQNNLIIDQNEIMARLNGNPSTLYLQTGGGNTSFGGGNVYMGSGGGKLSIGEAPLNAGVNINSISYQVYLRNDLDDVNDWYIGASAGSWQTGDDLLQFGPTSGHLNATLRLKNVTDNNGFEAPVMISSPSTQTIYLDGNEIDSQTPLYINQNSNEDTYINPSGGKVGVGNSNPDGMLHIKSFEQTLGLQRDFATWWITPTITGNINVYKNTTLLAYISWNQGGDWIAVSDRRLKENITPLSPVLDRINQLPLYSYRYSYTDNDQKDLGVMAQELEPLFPEAVQLHDDQYGVSYDQLTVIAIKGIQEQQKQLEDLHQQIDSLLANTK